MDLKNIENFYKPLPVWLWNGKLNTKNTLCHLDEMRQSGAGGFCIDNASGLQSKIFGSKWLRNISSSFAYAKEHSMQAWIYNDNPAVGADSVSYSLEYQQKFLCCEAGEKSNDRTIIFADGYHFFYDVNPYSIDVLDKNSAELFINEAYLPYIQKNTEEFYGFFCNSPRIFYNSIPWSFTLPAEYKNAYGEELLDVLIELFRPVGNYKTTRVKFWSLVERLFEQNFLKPLYEWCIENNLRFSAIFSQNDCNDNFPYTGLMTKYEYTHFPCVKAVSSRNNSPVSALMASSVTHQLDKEQSCAMLYSSCGHSHSFEQLKHIAEQYLVRGVDRIITCYSPYSLDGFRKRNTSTSVLYQPFRREENLKFNSYISRISKILTEGAARFDTLLLYNQSAVWSCFDAGINDGAASFTDDFEKAVASLERKHIPFHIGDEAIINKHAYVDGEYLVIGKERYNTIVIPENSVFSESITKLLSEFERCGGFITLADSLEQNDICDNENLLYTARIFPDYKIHYFVNNSPEEFTAAIHAGSRMLDISTGDVFPFYGIYKFAPYESIVVIDDLTPQSDRPFKKPLKTLDISGEWNIEQISHNSLVLDRCDVYVDGILTYPNENAADVTELLHKHNSDGEIECIYKLSVMELPQELYLAFENFDSFTIKINGITVEETLCENSYNDLFRKISVAQYFSEGENVISISGLFTCGEDFNALYEKAFNSPAEKERLTYEFEIGPLYLSGDFSLSTDGEFRKLDKDALRYIGDFKIDKRKTGCCISNLEQQGLTFFSGEITLSKTFNLSDTSYCLRFFPKSLRSLCVEVNGEKVDTILWSPYECDISNHLNKGDNVIKLTLTTNLRNLFGPHHIPMGELYDVSAGDFYKTPCLWNMGKETPWDDNYCFVETGLTEMR